MKRTATGQPAVRLSHIEPNAEAFEELPDNPTAAELKDAAVHVSLAELDERVQDVRDSWETDSLFEDVFEELTREVDDPADRTEACGPEECNRLRRELRELGPAVFCQRTVDAGRYTARKLLSAFGIRPPAFLQGEPDSAYFSLLSLAMSRELAKRAKLTRYNTVDDAVRLLDRAQNIIVITGAGISTSLGIPDFRSKGTGLYSKLEHLGLSDPQEVFDIDVFKEDPAIFYSVAKDIVPTSDRYTPTHKFIAMLHHRGKLLTNYSQNIDNLEVKAGLPKEKLVQCHGSFGTATCIQCGFRADGDIVIPDIKAGNIPRCPQCLPAARPTPRARSAPKRKRRRRWSASDSSDDDAADAAADSPSSAYDIPQAGVMKPDITFFGEALPEAFSKRLAEHDRDLVDLVVVIGTSLKVSPVSEIVGWLPPQVPQIYISRQPVDHVNFDIDLLGDCDVVVAELCRRLAWPLEHEMVPDRQEVAIRPEPGFPSRFVVEAVTPAASDAAWSAS